GSGSDKTGAPYGELILYRTVDQPRSAELQIERTIALVTGISGIESMTSKMLYRVMEAYNRRLEWYGTNVYRMDELRIQGREAGGEGDLEKLGLIMNLNHGYLNTLSVSSPEVEELIGVAREAGALGAKLTGGGGGGAIIAVCDSPEMQNKVQ